MRWISFSVTLLIMSSDYKANIILWGDQLKKALSSQWGIVAYIMN